MRLVIHCRQINLSTAFSGGDMAMLAEGVDFENSSSIPPFLNLFFNPF
jgi:hypothetical protein